MKTVYRIRAKKFCLEIIQLRLLAISNGFSKMNYPEQVRLKCECLRNELNNLNSDQQMKKFITDNYFKLKNIILKSQSIKEKQLEELLNEKL